MTSVDKTSDGPRSVAAQKQTKRTVGTFFVVSAVPIAWMVSQFLAIANRPPEWQFMDPTYTYLGNSVEVGQGLPAAHYQHPGFPVFWFLGPILRLADAVSGGQGLGTAIVLRTSFLFDVSSFALVILQVAALLFASLVLVRRLSLLSALLFQAIFFGLGATSSDVGPLGMQVALALILIGLLGPVLTDVKTPIGTARQLLIGLVLALAILTKLTSLPLVFFVAPLLSPRQLLRVLATVLITGLIGSLVAVRGSVIDMAVFFARVLPTTGRRPDETDGSLLSGLVTIPGNLSNLWPELSIVLVGLALIMIRPPRPPFSRRPYRLVAGVSLGFAGAALISVKAFQLSDFIAMLPPIAALGAVAFFYTLRSFSREPHRWAASLCAFLIVMVATTAVVQGARDGERSPLPPEKMEAVAYLESRLTSGQPTITTGSIPTPGTALFFGLGFSQRSFAPELIDAYPGYLDFNQQNSLIYIFGESGEVEAPCVHLKKLATTGDLQFIPGRDIELPVNQAQYESIDLEFIRNIGGWNVYRVISVSCPGDI